jgi:hypothetical protein
MILWKNHHNPKMKYKLPMLAALASLALLAANLFAQSPRHGPSAGTLSSHDQSTSNDLQRVPNNGSPVNGQQLIAQSAWEVFRQPSLEAKIRQRVDLHGHQLVGSGSYQQLGDGQNKLLRFELKLQVANRITSLQQVCDGRFLWVRHDLPERTTLSRIDIKQINEAVRSAQHPPAIDMNTTWIALGGLSKLLHGLNENFQFDNPLAAQIAQVPVWVVRGQWKDEKLAQLLPKQKSKIRGGQITELTDLPSHLPDSVEVTLGRDELFPLFPYRIEYRRQSTSAPNPQHHPAADKARSILTMELFEVRHRADLDPRMFQYKPGDQEVADHTSLYLQSLGLSPHTQAPDPAQP